MLNNGVIFTMRLTVSVERIPVTLISSGNQYPSVVFPTLLYINAGTTKVPAKGHKWPSLRLVRNPSERFQTSWNDNHKERDLRRTTLGEMPVVMSCREAQIVRPLYTRSMDCAYFRTKLFFPRSRALVH